MVYTHVIGEHSQRRLKSNLEHYPPSDGTILLNLNVAAERLKDFEAQVKVALLAEPLLYADETGSKVNGKLQWLDRKSVV